MSRTLPELYAVHREDGRTPAREAIAAARADMAAGKDRYKKGGRGWNPESDGARFAESADGCGLRFVGYADDIVRLDHKGWYADSFQDSTYRGVVLQFPARNGRPVFIGGYEDPHNPGTYRLEMDIFTGDDSEGEDAKRDAARSADGYAEKEAESAREYDETWQQGAKFADMKADESLNRKCVIELCAEIRAARRNGAKAGAAICSTLRDKVESLVESIRESREKRAEIVGNVWRDYRAAFNDGAQETIFEGV